MTNENIIECCVCCVHSLLRSLCTGARFIIEPECRKEENKYNANMHRYYWADIKKLPSVLWIKHTARFLSVCVCVCCEFASAYVSGAHCVWARTTHSYKSTKRIRYVLKPNKTENEEKKEAELKHKRSLSLSAAVSFKSYRVSHTVSSIYTYTHERVQSCCISFVDDGEIRFGMSQRWVRKRSEKKCWEYDKHIHVLLLFLSRLAHVFQRRAHCSIGVAHCL